MASQSPDDVSVFHFTGDQDALTAWLALLGGVIVRDTWVNDAVFRHRIGGGPDDYITAAPGQLLAGVGMDLSRDISLVLPRC